MLTQAEIAAIRGTDIYDDCLEHSGVKGMHWYERRYQYPDGRLTPLGRLHYGIGQRREAKKTKIMQSGNAKKVLKYQKHLTDEEFEQAMARVGRSEALKKVANAPKEAKKAEKAAKEAAKQAEKIQEEKIKLSEKELKNAKDIAKENAKQSIKAAKRGDLLSKGLKIAGSIAAAYGTYKKIANMVSDLTGKDLPGVGDMTLFGRKKKDDDKDSSKSESKETRDTELELGDYKGGDKDKPKPRPFTDPPGPPKPTPEPKKDTDDFSFFEAFNLDKTRNNGIIGRGEGDHLNYGGGGVSVDGPTYHRWDSDALDSVKAKKASGGLGSSLVPSLSQKSVNTGTEIVNSILSGTVEGTGTHFKDTKTSSFSDNTLAIGMNTIADILALPYDPNKKF